MNALKLTVVIAVIALAACSQTATQSNTPENVNKAAVVATPATAAKPVDELASGVELYATNCQICHRDTGNAVLNNSLALLGCRLLSGFGFPRR